MSDKKLPYGDVNVPMFLRVKEQILNEPTSFHMGIFGAPSETACGTVACLAGWANTLSAQDQGLKRDAFRFGDTESACRILGLEYRATTDGHPMFYLHWPRHYQKRYQEANRNDDRRGMAKAAAEFIDYVCGLRDANGNLLEQEQPVAAAAAEVATVVEEKSPVAVAVEC